jgi:hypothetical protein
MRDNHRVDSNDINLKQRSCKFGGQVTTPPVRVLQLKT